MKCSKSRNQRPVEFIRDISIYHIAVRIPRNRRNAQVLFVKTVVSGFDPQVLADGVGKRGLPVIVSPAVQKKRP